MAYSLPEEDWPVAVRDAVLPGCGGVCLAKSPKDAGLLCRTYFGKVRGASALISRTKVPEVPADKQHMATLRIQETKDGQPARMLQLQAYIVQLGDEDVWPMASKALITVPTTMDRTTVMAVEVRKK